MKLKLKAILRNSIKIVEIVKDHFEMFSYKCVYLKHAILRPYRVERIWDPVDTFHYIGNYTIIFFCNILMKTFKKFI